jgi:pyridoxal biosynthesis lyase PdxS
MHLEARRLRAPEARQIGEKGFILDPAQRAAACVKATTFWDDPKVIADASRGLGEAMVGINVADIPVPHRLAERGW